MMSKPKVLLLGKIDLAHDAWAKLEQEIEVVVPKSDNREDFIKECQDSSSALQGIVACYRTFHSVTVTGFWDDELVKALPSSLRFVSHNGAGYDQLIPSALSAHSPHPIVATNVPTAVDNATADTALFLLLGALRNFHPSLLSVQKTQWRGQPTPCTFGHDPQGKTLGILGMGGIGRNLARKCRAFDMDIIYHNRNRLSEKDEGGARYVSFDELLSTSDVISVHVPLNQHTRHLLGQKEFARMKPGVVIINTARGAVIDEGALTTALNAGHIGAVGLDVFEKEPEIHPGLIDNPKAFILPHMGTWSVETQTQMEEWNMENVRRGVRWATNGEAGGVDGMSVIGEQRDVWEQWKKDGIPK